MLFLLTILLLMQIFVSVKFSSASPQCNLGLKLFSVESGKAICAPIAPFQCVESCEWIDGENGWGCTQSFHYAAFGGRRTYVAGLVLSEQNFLLQCCASLATTVIFDYNHDPLCHWTEEIDTVVEQPSVRFEKVLGELAYYRNFRSVRYGRSAVKMQAEVCRYGVQRASCEKEKLSQEDLRKYLLLLIRLQRARELIKNDHNITRQLNVGSSALVAEENQTNTENDINNHFGGRIAQRAIFRNRTTENNSSGGQMVSRREFKEFGPVNKSSPRMEHFGRRFWGEREEIVSPIIFHTIPTTKPQQIATTTTRNTITSTAVAQNFVNNSLTRPFTQNDEHNIQNGQKEMVNANRQPNPKVNRTVFARQRHNHDTVLGSRIAIRRIRYPQAEDRKEPQPAKLDWPKGMRHRIWPVLATNTTKELIPARTDQKWLDGEYSGTELRGGLIRNGVAGRTNQDQWQKNSFSQNPIRRELPIRKLESNREQNNNNGVDKNNGELIGAGGSASGAGGSFGPDDDDNNDSTELSEQIQTPDLPSFFTNQPLSQFGTHSLERAPQFKFVSLVQKKLHLPRHNNNNIDEDKLSRLMDCCQQQAPGCRAICRRNVDKEQVKQVMSSGHCPPISLTNVIQCFPRFFNISAVSQCCAMGISKFPQMSPQRTKNDFPFQCLSLCSPNFHLSFAHLACIEHIEHILDCYRQLLDGTINRQQNNNQLEVPFS